MAVLKVLKAPDSRLKVVSKPVDHIDDKIRQLIADMFETMYAEDGMGLAAIQVNAPYRILVMDLSTCYEGREPDPKCYINPEIIWSSEETAVLQESCLSVPGQAGEVTRPARIKIKYMDENAVNHEVEADDLFATCLQHEIDHLNGILYIDHLSKLKYDIIMKKLLRLKKLR